MLCCIRQFDFNSSFDCSFGNFWSGNFSFFNFNANSDDSEHDVLKKLRLLFRCIEFSFFKESDRDTIIRTMLSREY